MTSPSGAGGAKRSTCFARVSPVQVMASPFSSPASSSSLTMTWMPPFSSISTIEYCPNGRALINTGTTCCDRWLNSSGDMMSLEKLPKPAARAISGPCNRTLVEPPTAMATIIALRIESRLTILRGERSLAINCSRYDTSSLGNCSIRLGSSEGGETMCRGSMPTTAMKVCMVL